MPNPISKAAKISAHVLSNSRNSKASTKVVMTSSRQRIGFSRNRTIEEKREATRQRSYGDIWVDPGELANPIFCKVLDISHGGARLMVQGASVLPDAFVMCMGTSKRHARVMWRSGQEVGVEFEKSRKKPEPRSPRSAPTSEPAAPESDASSKLSPPEAVDLGGEESSHQSPAVANAAANNEGDRLNVALTRLRQRLEKMRNC
jgi:hypothetical protein